MKNTKNKIPVLRSLIDAKPVEERIDLPKVIKKRLSGCCRCGKSPKME